MDDELTAAVIAGYHEMFDEPDHIAPADEHAVFLLYLAPERAQDPDEDTTLLWTAGLSAHPNFRDHPCELSISIAGRPDDAWPAAMAASLAELGSAPARTGEPYEAGQILTGVTLPGFSRFSSVMLLDWGVTYGVELSVPGRDMGLVRVIPLFPSEAAFIEGSSDRTRAYHSLRNRPMREADPDREPAV
ncbi:hypothetical protein AB0F72_17260 [Actinoplanes sp. NPDC023936]|uniref:hypothetical protein n=1 Tax=Actinoplanes sp. NPDC023936 TaxID=3154910 RepID=UPI0033F66524